MDVILDLCQSLFFKYDVKQILINLKSIKIIFLNILKFLKAQSDINRVVNFFVNSNQDIYSYNNPLFKRVLISMWV